MKKSHLLIFTVLFLIMSSNFSCTPKVKDVTKTTPPTTTKPEIIGVGSSNLPKYDYESVPGDPMGVKIYTLKNGMKVYMSVNKSEPRINTSIAVRAGSKHDPADATGLAHYLEHMMFKGTSNMGSLNWAEEKVMLQEISDLYEQHRQETDPEKRKKIYAEIDRVSGEAAKLVAANEYDKMVSSLGAKGTNAYTYVEQTVYINDIPSNELDRWMQLESERFKEVVLRLFHTELEAVYEEFNIGQDSDFRKGNTALMEALFPNHPYGLQSTIGKGEHLKNPSHEKIQEYFHKSDEMVAKAEKYFGEYEKQMVPEFTFPPAPPITKKIVREVYGQEGEYIDIAWRFDGIKSDDPIMLSMLSQVLYNRQAGLIDLNLIQKQKALEADAWTWNFEDYSALGLWGKPREGQSLQDLEKLLIGELEKVKRGEFDEWLMKAAIKNLKLREIRANEYNRARNGAMVDAYIKDKSWSDYVNRWKKMEAITKNQLVAFANKISSKHYAVVYKKTGEDKSVVKVDKPSITPVAVNREETSDYTKKFMAQETSRLSPVFIDYKKEISESKLTNGVAFDYIKNKNNQTFSINYIVEMGKNSDKLLPMAVSYLPFLGTDKYTAEQLKQEFFKLGLSFDVFSGDDRVYVTLSGLDESFEEGVQLFEHILGNVKGDAGALKNVVADIMKEREDTKKDKWSILRGGMANYALYGKNSSYTDVYSESELKKITPEQLVEQIKTITNYDHKIFYYGSKSANSVKTILNQYHKVPAQLKPVKMAKKYPELSTDGNKVYFVDHPMVQAEVLMSSKGTPNFNLDEYIMSQLYNTYFGAGLSSIVFQEIRESKALAYSAYAFYTSPSKKDRSHQMVAYVGTQVDKLKDAVPAMQEIIENMPFSEDQIEQARQSLLKKYESERVNNTSIYWASRSAKDKGYDRDLREDVYERLKTVTPAELKSFQEKFVKNRNYTICVLGSKESVDMDYLKSLGNLIELKKEDIFGY